MSGKGRRFIVRDRSGNAATAVSHPSNTFAVSDETVAKYPLLAEKSDLNAHAEVLKWLVYERNISLHTLAKFTPRLYVGPADAIGVVFPVIDRDGVVRALWARSLDDERCFRIAGDASASGLFFGGQIFDPARPVILVDDPMAALRLHSLGVGNVLAAFGEMPETTLTSLFAPVVHLGFANDAAGHRFTKKAVSLLRVPSLHFLDWGTASLHDAGDLESLDQFKTVFNARRKIIHKATRTPDTRPSPAPLKRSVRGDRFSYPL